MSSSSLNWYFPEEILTEVFARLPVKSLLRFRCVSKTWRNLIDNPDLVSLHLSCYNNKNNRVLEKFCHILTYECGGGLLYFAARRSDTLEEVAQLATIPGMYRPRASVDGLILLSCLSFKINDKNRYLQLWNPFIRKSLQLPPCSLLFGGRSIYAMGFASSSNQYKVVVFDGFYLFEPAFAVHGLSDGCWRKSTKGMDVVDWWKCKMNLQCLSTKDAAYWLISLPNGVHYTHVVSFDFDAETFSFLELPDHGAEMVWLLFLLGESVVVLGISIVSTCIWVMDKDGGKERWTKWYSGDSSTDVYEFWKGYEKDVSSGEILYVKNSGVFLMISHRRDRELRSYNIRSHEISCLSKSWLPLYMYTYVESLLLHKGVRGSSNS